MTDLVNACLPSTPVCPFCGPTRLQRVPPTITSANVLTCTGCGRVDSAVGWERRERREA